MKRKIISLGILSALIGVTFTFAQSTPDVNQPDAPHITAVPGPVVSQDSPTDTAITPETTTEPTSRPADTLATTEGQESNTDSAPVVPADLPPAEAPAPPPTKVECHNSFTPVDDPALNQQFGYDVKFKVYYDCTMSDGTTTSQLVTYSNTKNVSIIPH